MLFLPQKKDYQTFLLKKRYSTTGAPTNGVTAERGMGVSVKAVHVRLHAIATIEPKTAVIGSNIRKLSVRKIKRVI